MKSSKSVLFRLIVLFCTIILFSFIGFFWWKDAISPANNKDVSPIEFTVEKGEGVKSIAGRLFEQGLIRSPTGFFLMVKFLRKETNIQAGDFRLTKAMTSSQIVEQLTHGTQDVWVTIPEGWRTEEIATELAKTLNIPEQEFLGVSKEGYMFPDTYRFPQDATAGAVAQVFEDNFRKKIPASLYNQQHKNQLSPQEIIILASLVEREGKNDSDRPIIAGILLNRLRIDMPLQVDATLQYALGYQSNEKTWWKKELTDVDKKVESDFNTYIYPGLPPAPIANPGVSAIIAVINPEKTDYLYYIHDTSGIAHYGKTLSDHTNNIQKYLR